MKINQLNIIEISGKIQVLSGLHIGAGNDEIKIGGIDNPVVKNPLNNQPYIPGSSLKGKIRSLLEWKSGKVTDRGEPWSASGEGDFITQIFGNGKSDDSYTGGPTRAIFNDCFLTNAELLTQKNALTEQKVEVSINRVSGTAAKSGPRHSERVPAGAEFGFNLSYLILNDNDKKNFPYILLGMKLLELTALGGSGSRGYGRVQFELESKKEYEEYLDSEKHLISLSQIEQKVKV